MNSTESNNEFSNNYYIDDDGSNSTFFKLKLNFTSSIAYEFLSNSTYSNELLNINKTLLKTASDDIDKQLVEGSTRFTFINTFDSLNSIDMNKNSPNNTIESTDVVEYLSIQFLLAILKGEFSLIWVIVGTIGNLLSLFVLMRKKMRIHSTFTYLTLLAVCDLFVLYFGLLRDYLVHKYKWDITGDLFCKFHVFSFYFLLHMASWLLVAVNVDRLVAASFLGLSKKWCTPRKALRICFWLTLFFALLNSHFIFYVHSSYSSSSIISSYPSDLTLSSTHRRYFTHPAVNNSIESDHNISLSSLTDYKARTRIYFYNKSLSRANKLLTDLFINRPLTNNITNLFNDDYFYTVISTKFTLADENNFDISNNTKKEEPVNPYVYSKCLIKANSPIYSYFFQNIFSWLDASAQVILPFIIMVICNVNIIHKVLLTKNKTNGRNLKRLRKIKGMCIMIVSVSVIFFVLEAPILIFICLMQAEWINPDLPHIDLLWTTMNLMMYTNHVINFISYCMTGTKFRRELLRLLYFHKLSKFFSNYLGIISSSTANNRHQHNHHNHHHHQHYRNQNHSKHHNHLNSYRNSIPNTAFRFNEFAHVDKKLMLNDVEDRKPLNEEDILQDRKDLSPGLKNDNHASRLKENLKSRFGLTFKILAKKNELNKEIKEKEQEHDEDVDDEMSDNLVSNNYTFQDTNSLKRKNSQRTKLKNSDSKNTIKAGTQFNGDPIKEEKVIIQNRNRAFKSLNKHARFKLFTKPKEFAEKEIQTENNNWNNTQILSSVNNQDDCLFERSPINTRNMIYKVKSFEDQVEINIDNEED